MQTSADQPLDLNDRGQGVDRRPPTSPEAYQERLDRFEASGVYEAHAAKFEAAKAKAAAERFRRGVRSAEGFPCPEPAFTPSHSEADLLDADDQAAGDSGYRRGLIGGYMNGTSWDGFTAWGRAYQAGQEAGRFWRIRWGLYSQVAGHYFGSKDTREEAERVSKGLGISFRPIPY